MRKLALKWLRIVLIYPVNYVLIVPLFVLGFREFGWMNEREAKKEK